MVFIISNLDDRKITDFLSFTFVLFDVNEIPFKRKVQLHPT